VLEREANSSRQEWGGSAAFYREQEGRRKGHWWSSRVLPFPARNGRRNGRRERKNKSPLTRWINHAHKRTDGGFSNGQRGSRGVAGQCRGGTALGLRQGGMARARHRAQTSAGLRRAGLALGAERLARGGAGCLGAAASRVGRPGLGARARHAGAEAGARLLLRAQDREKREREIRGEREE
jgi:hypothetical protein